MKRFVGISMLISLFVGMFIFTVNQSSLQEALQYWGIVGAIATFISIAVFLINPDT